MQSEQYGSGDATFQAAGGEAGVAKLVDTFYDIMETDPAYKRIWQLHPAKNETTRDKLARFLCGWMGGPKRYQEKYGSISIPQVHAHIDVATAEKGQWLSCMKQALAQQDYPQSLIDYLLNQLAIPAEHIRRHSETRSDD
jgi:hemoglobin